MTLSRYISTGKIPAPKTVMLAGMPIHAWTEQEVEKARKLLPKIANGRKTRYQKLREQQKTQARTPALPKTKRKPQTKEK